jgi:hypothetical protein
MVPGKPGSIPPLTGPAPASREQYTESPFFADKLGYPKFQM